MGLTNTTRCNSVNSRGLAGRRSLTRRAGVGGRQCLTFVLALASGLGLGAASETPGRPELAIQTGHTGAVADARWSSDGRYLASRDDASVKVWGPQSGRLLADLTPGSVNAMVWSPDGRHIALAVAGQGILIWSTRSGSYAPPLQSPEGIKDLAWSPDGAWLAARTPAGVAIWETDRWQLGPELAEARGPIAWSSDGSLLATGATIWDVGSGQAVARLAGYRGSPSLAWSPRGEYVAAETANRVRIWDTTEGRLLHEVESNDHIRDIAWWPDGRHLAVVSLSLRVLAVDSGEEGAAFTQAAELGGHTSWIHDVSWSPDGRFLSTASGDATARIWRIPGFAPVAELRGHLQDVNTVSWSPGSDYVATASVDHTVRVWTAEGRAAATMTAHMRAQLTVDWSADGKYIACGGSDSPVRVWEVASGQVIASFGGEKRLRKQLSESWKLASVSVYILKPKY